MSRISRRFADLRARGRAGLITFLTAGDPDMATFEAVLAGLPASGADLIEVGVPFSDPMADGPAIQAAGLRALKDAAATGVDGLIIVDLPPEESDEFLPAATAAGLELIRLTAPTSDDARLPKVLTGAGGFVYHVAIAGITGTRSASIADVQPVVERIRRHTTLPVAIGFGIRTPDQAAATAEIADAVVVGSALVETVALNLDTEAGPGLVAALHAQVAALAAGVRRVARGK